MRAVRPKDAGTVNSQVLHIQYQIPFVRYSKWQGRYVSCQSNSNEIPQNLNERVKIQSQSFVSPNHPNQLDQLIEVD